MLSERKREADRLYDPITTNKMRMSWVGGLRIKEMLNFNPYYECLENKHT